MEETTFVDNPENADLFSVPPSCDKPPEKEQPSSSAKTSDKELQMLNTLLAEQAEKQARLQQLRIRHSTVKTREVAVQLESKKTAEAAVQTDFPDIMEDLKKQVVSLARIVAEMTELKEMSRPSPSLLNDPEPLRDLGLSVINDVLAEPLVPSPTCTLSLNVPEPPENRTAPASGQNQLMQLSSPTNLCPQLRSPLTTIDTNAQLEFSSLNRGPTDDQKRKVEAIVIMGTQMVPTSMACINVLFSETELANGNTSGTSGYQRLDILKLRFLEAVLRRKYDSDTFRAQWEDVKTKINTRCRGKRRTALRRLQKHINF